MGNSHAVKRGGGALLVLRQWMMVGKNAGAAEESGEDNVDAGSIGGAGGEKIGRDDTQKKAKLENVPDRAAEDGHGHVFLRKGITFASDGFDQRGFARAIGAEDANVFAGLDEKREAVEGEIATANDGDVAEIEERRRGFHGWRIYLIV